MKGAKKMPKQVIDQDMDEMLHAIAVCDELHVCHTEPTNYADVLTYTLAKVTLTPAHGGGDFTVGPGDTAGGRKLTTAQQTDVPITATGEANWVVLVEVGNTLMHVKTTVTPQQLTQNNSVTVPAWDIEIGAAT